MKIKLYIEEQVLKYTKVYIWSYCQEVLFYCGLNRVEDFRFYEVEVLDVKFLSTTWRYPVWSFLSTVRGIDEVEDHGPKVRAYFFT